MSGGGLNSGTDRCSEIDEDDAEELEDEMEMTKQSRAAMNNKRWKPQSDAWLNDRALIRAEREEMEPEEESFWEDVIEKYLSPLSVDTKDQERVRAGLLELRNRVSLLSLSFSSY